MGIFVLRILVAAGGIVYQSESRIAAKLLLLRTCCYRIIALPLSSLTKSYSRSRQVFFWRLLTSLAFALVQVLNLRFFSSSRIRFQFCIRVSRGYMIPSIRLSIRPPKSTEPSEPELLSGSSKSGGLLPLSHPMPSLSPSNPCGSGGTTSKLRVPTSSQVKFGGRGGIHISGYEESHTVSSVSSARGSSTVGDSSVGGPSTVISILSEAV